MAHFFALTNQEIPTSTSQYWLPQPHSDQAVDNLPVGADPELWVQQPHSDQAVNNLPVGSDPELWVQQPHNPGQVVSEFTTSGGGDGATTYYQMTGLHLGSPVTWVVNGNPDFTGTSAPVSPVTNVKVLISWVET